jgi:uncharacterized protein (TIGR00369 family)
LSDVLEPEACGWSREEDGTFVTSMGAIYVRHTDAGLEVALQTDASHRNLSGNVHGGVILTLLDRVMGINCRNAVEGGASTATISVNFLHPVRTGDFLRATCQLSRVGRTLVFAEARAYVGERLVATGSSICSRRAPAT